MASLYLLKDEWAAESANKTVCGIIHAARVRDENGGYHIVLAVYVRRNGLLGTASMLRIRPFRRVLVCPAIMRELERER